MRLLATLFVLSLLHSREATSVNTLLQQTWWNWLPEFERIWHTVQTEPIYFIFRKRPSPVYTFIRPART